MTIEHQVNKHNILSFSPSLFSHIGLIHLLWRNNAINKNLNHLPSTIILYRLPNQGIQQDFSIVVQAEFANLMMQTFTQSKQTFSLYKLILHLKIFNNVEGIPNV